MQKEEVAKEEILEEEERRKRKEEAKKEELKVKAPERIEKRAEAIPLKKEGERLIVPLIKLEKVSESELEKLEVSKEIPQIGKRRRTVSIPIIELQEPSLMLREYELDYKLPHIEKAERLLTIPIIRANPPPKVSILITEFDTEIRKPSKITLPKIRVPVYRKAISISPKFLLESFDSTINEQIIRSLVEKKEEIETKLSIERIEAEKLETEAPSPAKEEEIPDFLEFLFGSEGGRIRARGPKIILFKDLEGDSYVSFLENICLRIYREREGGEPKAIKIRKMDEMNKREIEKWLEVGGKIFTIDLEGGEVPDEIHLWERLEETYSEKLGFIIFTVRKEEKFEYLRELLRKINLKTQGRLNIINLEAKRLPPELIRLSSGMISLEKPPIEVKVEVEKIPTLTTFDYMLNETLFKEESLFNKVLEKVKNEERGLFKESTNPAKEVESPLHFDIKVFLVRYLTHKLRKEGKKLSSREEVMREIETEKDLSPEVIPDLKVGSEVYEVETLFGAGEEPDLKINKTVDKYDKIPNIAKVNIIMDNFGFLLHLRELFRKKEHFKNKKFDVEFYTLDLQNKKLVSLSDFAKELKQCLKY